MNVTRAAQLGDGPSGKTPGPIYKPKYHFDSSLPNDAKIIFGTSTRFPSSEKQIGPGPGAYGVPQEAKGPAFSLRFREKFGTPGVDGRRDNPAPGHVVKLETTQTRRANAPAFSIRSRRAPARSGGSTPAPGHTQHVTSASDKQVSSDKPNLPGMKFGTGGRPKDQQGSAIVGPGEYDTEKGQYLLTENKKPPAYTLTGRPKDRKADRVQPDFHSSTAWASTLPLSHQKNAPKFSMSGRTKFGDPYAV